MLWFICRSVQCNVYAVIHYRSVQCEHIRHMQDYTSQFGLLVSETKKRLSHVTMVASMLATMSLSAIVYSSGLQTLCNKLDVLRETFTEVSIYCQTDFCSVSLTLKCVCVGIVYTYMFPYWSFSEHISDASMTVTHT